MTPPLSEEALEAYSREADACADPLTPESPGVMAVRIEDMRSLISEVRHLRSERSGYRQGLEDAGKAAAKESERLRQQGDTKEAAGAMLALYAISDLTARLDVDAGQGSEHITRGVQPQGDEHAQGDEEGSGEAR